MTVEVERAEPARARRRTGAWISILAVAAFATGLAIANWPVVSDRAMEFFALMGQPRLDAMRAMEEPVVGPDGIARSDWLVFFEDESSTSDRQRLLAEHESVRFVDTTIFANGVVLSIPDAAKLVVSAIRSSPAVWLMLKDRPFYLCH